jgi:type II secretory ATPase GspE/PulE/Tfp pilus assembly ATPase PilB-like protein
MPESLGNIGSPQNPDAGEHNTNPAPNQPNTNLGGATGNQNQGTQDQKAANTRSQSSTSQSDNNQQNARPAQPNQPPQQTPTGFTPQAPYIPPTMMPPQYGVNPWMMQNPYMQTMQPGFTYPNPMHVPQQPTQASNSTANQTNTPQNTPKINNQKPQTSFTPIQLNNNESEEVIEPLPAHLSLDQRPKLGADQSFAMPQTPDGSVDVIKLVDNIFITAKTNNASDIHIEPTENDLQVRFRVDGEFYQYFVFPKQVTKAVITRVMVQSGLKIDESRLPQDGKIAFRSGDLLVDMRVSTFPTMYGDKIVLRLLDRDAKARTLEELGYRGKALIRLRKNLKRTYGMVLVAGPTGSGKSTTLFSMLSMYDPFKHNISTLEDPIEYVINGVNQAQVHPEIGFDFADGLRSLVRQDPDVIMIGEIRDKVSANLAVQAALTGHLVFATVHANSAAATIQRLSNMGVDPFLAASALNVIVSQRLVRKICEHCKQPQEVPPEYLDSISELVGGIEKARSIQFMKGTGCSHCGDSGYKGRLAVYEVLPVTPSLQNKIIEKPIATYIQAAAVQNGMETIKRNAIKAAIKGETTLEEALLAVDETFS